MRRHRKGARALTITAIVMLLLASTAAGAGAGQWPFAGNTPQNTRWQPVSGINAGNAPKLATLWQVNTAGGITATPAVDATKVYVPDNAGNLYAIDRATGAVIWSRTIVSYTGVSGDFVSTTPAIVGSTLIFGDMAGTMGSPASVVAVNANTGGLIWLTHVDTNAFSVVTQSAVVNGRDVYVGINSIEQSLTDGERGYPCCTFRGSLVKLDADTGAILWKTYTTPLGSSGVPVAGSTPAIDTTRGMVFVATGNNYSLPTDTINCLTALGGTITTPGVQGCITPSDLFDSVVALDLTTGGILWITRTWPDSPWDANCAAKLLPGLAGNPALCPTDYAYTQGPALIGADPATPPGLLGVGQTSGKYWALNPVAGNVAWVTQVGPGGPNGGLYGSAATDGRRIYVAGANSPGFWGALDATTGQILWQTADPQAAGNRGAVSGSNDVIFGCSSGGRMHALNAITGQLLWANDSGQTCAAGAAIVDRTVYWGTGGTSGPGSLFAFQQPTGVLSAVTGNATYGDSSATLSARLTLNTPGGSPLTGQLVSFTLFGTPVGSATTNAQGVATLAGAPLPPGTPSGTARNAVCASFAGTATFAPTGPTCGPLQVARRVLWIKPIDRTVKLKQPNPPTDPRQDPACPAPTYCLALTRDSSFAYGQSWSALNLSALRSQFSRNPPSTNATEFVGKTYRITAFGVTSSNYDIRYDPGTMTVIAP